MSQRYVIALVYWVMWMALGWGTFAIYKLSRRKAPKVQAKKSDQSPSGLDSIEAVRAAIEAEVSASERRQRLQVIAFRRERVRTPLHVAQLRSPATDPKIREIIRDNAQAIRQRQLHN